MVSCAPRSQGGYQPSSTTQWLSNRYAVREPTLRETLYQRYRCFRSDDVTSSGEKIDDPRFWSILVDLVDGSWVIQQPEGTHSHDAVDYSMP